MTAAQAPLAVRWRMRREEGGLRAPSATHLTDAAGPGDVTNGGFPLACGRWAPDGFDAQLERTWASGRVCRRCAVATRRSESA
jgi:hypothetical protein